MVNKRLVIILVVASLFALGIYILTLNRDIYRGILVFGDGGGDIYLGLTGNGRAKFNKLENGLLDQFRLKYFPALSRNAIYLAFIAENSVKSEDNQKSLFTLVIIKNKKDLFKEYSVQYQTIPVAETIGMLAWSPDSTKLAYFSAEKYVGMVPAGRFESTLKILDLENHTIDTITKIRGVNEAIPSWSLDGKFVYFSAWNQNKARFEVVRCNIKTKQLEILTEGAAPSCSPVDAIILFSDDKNIYESDLDGKNKRILIENYKAISFYTPIILAPDGKSFLYFRYNISNFKPFAIVQTILGIYHELVVTSLDKLSKRTTIYKTDKSFWGLSWVDYPIFFQTSSN